MEYLTKDLIDFASNDYLGFSKNKIILEETNQHFVENNSFENGEIDLEIHIAKFHQTKSVSIFNSAKEAYRCFFVAIPQKGDFIFYDELCHTSIRDAIQFSNAKCYPYQHNDFEDLERLIENLRTKTQDPTTIYILTESVFSMDGDRPNLEELVALCGKYNCRLVIDESHSIAVFGEKGQGLVSNLYLQEDFFARIISFNNALGCEGASIISSNELKKHFDNFDPIFINKIRLSLKSVTEILAAYKNLEFKKESIQRLRENIVHFNQEINLLGLKPMFVRSKSAIHSAIIPGNYDVKFLAEQFQEKGFEVKAILSPLVPEGQERLRFCIHSFNTKEEITELLGLLSMFVFG